MFANADVQLYAKTVEGEFVPVEGASIILVDDGDILAARYMGPGERNTWENIGSLPPARQYEKVQR